MHIAQHLIASNFAKNCENVKGELCLNVIIPFSIIVCCLVVARWSKNGILSEPKWEAQAAVREGTTPPGPLVATALLMFIIVKLSSSYAVVFQSRK